jgi:hypothetical protein
VGDQLERQLAPEGCTAVSVDEGTEGGAEAQGGVPAESAACLWTSWRSRMKASPASLEPWMGALELKRRGTAMRCWRMVRERTRAVNIFAVLCLLWV